MNACKQMHKVAVNGLLISATLAGGLISHAAIANEDANQGAQASAQQADSQRVEAQRSDARQSEGVSQLSTQQNPLQNQQLNNAPASQQNAAAGQQENSQQTNPGMDQVDKNNDAELVWSEIYAIYNEELNQAGWSEDSVFGSYDQNADASLNADEYVIFIGGLTEASASQNGGASVNNQQTAQGNQGQAGQQNQEEQTAAPTTVVSVVTVAETGLAPTELEEREVINYNNDTIGNVEEVVTAPDGTISGLVVGVGGFWGIGEKHVFVPVEEVKVYGEQVIWETFLGEDQLADMPRYQAKTYSANP